MDKEVKRVFTPKPMISFRSARKLKSYLVRAKFYPTEGTVGSYKTSTFTGSALFIFKDVFYS